MYAAAGSDGVAQGSLYRVDSITGQLDLIGATGFETIDAPIMHGTPTFYLPLLSQGIARGRI